ncbi:MAG TPA: extracellular matrix/biofilm biosynthesis regulator RemA family protein, partial [Syntrophomonadaceae bacterium]|nr:extracellular matrix/biofilm biosynthesis regulator RemA family protein [Syntrophomonadaceae bacterium]
IMHVALDEKKLINISDNEKKKALIICEDNIYISPISSLTLYKRSLNYYKEGIYFERSAKSK